MTNIIAYTCLFAARDEPLCLIKDANVRYIVFTDDDYYKNKTFDDIILVKNKSFPRMKSREIKSLSHQYLPEHDFSIWFDGSMRPNSTELSGLCSNIKHIAAFTHRENFSILDIVKNCKNYKWDYPLKIDIQIKKYIDEGLPLDIQTFESGIFVRNNTDEVSQFNELWWKEICSGSERDQISLPYCLWKTGQTCTPLSKDKGSHVCHNKYFQYIEHPSFPKEIPYL